MCFCDKLSRTHLSWLLTRIRITWEVGIYYIGLSCGKMSGHIHNDSYGKSKPTVEVPPGLVALVCICNKGE